jgi:hypothetical protein
MTNGSGSDGRDFGLTHSIVRQRTRRFFPFLASAAIFSVSVLFCSTTRASTTEVIYSFGGGADGEYLDTDEAIDAAGNH